MNIPIETWKLVVVWALIASAAAYGVMLIVWANECAFIGGAFLIPDNGFPVCLSQTL